MNDSTPSCPAAQSPSWMTGLRAAFPGEPGPSAEDLASAEAEYRRKYGPDEPRPIRDARDLLISIGDHLASIGLEPDLRAGCLDVLFLGRRHRVSLVDLDRDFEESCGSIGDMARPRDRHHPDALARIGLALYGTSDPAHA